MQPVRCWLGSNGQRAPVAGSRSVFRKERLQSPVATDPRCGPGVQQVTCQEDRAFPGDLLKQRGTAELHGCEQGRLLSAQPDRDLCRRRRQLPLVKRHLLRVVQEVARRYLEPVPEPVFHANSYGYRPGKSAVEAVRHSSRALLALRLGVRCRASALEAAERHCAAAARNFGCNEDRKPVSVQSDVTWCLQAGR